MTANHRALEESDIKLIEKVKMTASLYDSRNPDFRLAYRKEQDWESVGTYVGLGAGDARRRWTCLRDRYSRELKQFRLNPEKGEFGRNEFFRRMDFLRKFVRKRKERRRHPMYKYDSSWDGSMDETKQAAKMNDLETVEEEISTIEDTDYQEEEQQDYSNDKIEEEATETEEYHEFVEVDASESYEEYAQQPPVAEEANCSVNTKRVIPIILPAQVDGATYTVSTTQHQPVHLKGQQELSPAQTQALPVTPPQAPHYQPLQTSAEVIIDPADDFFCKSIAAYLRQLSRRHKIKAKVEMFQILEKYIELEDDPANDSNQQKS